MGGFLRRPAGIWFHPILIGLPAEEVKGGLGLVPPNRPPYG